MMPYPDNIPIETILGVILKQAFEEKKTKTWDKQIS